MERIKKYRVSLICLAAFVIIGDVLSLIPKPIRASTAFSVVCLIVLFSLIWLAAWSFANVAKETHPWLSGFLKLFVVLQMLAGVVITILALTGVVHLQLVTT